MRPAFGDSSADGREPRALFGAESSEDFAIAKSRLQVLPITAEVIVAYSLE